MLVQKKIEGKKLLSYIFIIVFMIGGTIFFIQKNRALTSRRPDPVIVATNEGLENELGEDIITDNNSDNITEEDLQNSTLDEGGKLLELNSGKIMDLDILFDDKFKKLKKIEVEPVEFIVGNKDLFKSE